MYGRMRRKTRPEAQHEPRFIQEKFDGGLNSDSDSTAIAGNEFAVLENLIAFHDGVEGRSGTQLLTATSLPGSGTIHDYFFHKGAGKHLLWRGGAVYSADVDMTTWTEIKAYKNKSASSQGFVANGGLSQTSTMFGGCTTSNTDAGILYWNLTNSGSTRTFNVYKNSGKTQLVAQGVRIGDGAVGLVPQNSSKLYGSVYITYTGDDTDSGNTITGLLDGDSIFGGLYTPGGKMVPYGNDAIIFPYQQVALASQVPQICITYLDLTNTELYYLGTGSYSGGAAVGLKYMPSLGTVQGSGSEGASTPYGRRYLYTFSRIVDSTNAVDLTLNRNTGVLKFETMAIPVYSSAQVKTFDYSEYWFANAVSVSNPNSVDMLAQQNVFLSTVPVDFLAPPHTTHVSLYATLDIGTTYGVDPETGAGNNREIYVWIADVPRCGGGVAALTFSDTVTDAVLRARYDAGYGLRTRFFDPMDVGEVGMFAGSFMYMAPRYAAKYEYCQLAKPEFLGFYRPDFQFGIVDDKIYDMRRVAGNAEIFCSGSTYESNPKIYEDKGSVEPIFVLRGPSKISSSIGVMDYGSIAYIDENSVIAHCSDRTIRILSGSAWGQTDLAANRVSNLIQSFIIPASVGVYIGGVYLLWYASTGSITNGCLRYGFGGKSGYGWSSVTGGDFPFPPFRVGAAIINDSSSRERLIVLDSGDAQFHWVETFTNQSLTKVYKDKVAVAGTGGTNIYPKFRVRSLTGETESQECYHEESHVYLRPSGSSFLSGFSLTAIAYVDGGSSATASIGASTSGGDIQYFDRVRGKRIQQEYAFIGSGFKVVKTDTHYQVHDTAVVGDGPAESNEAGFQTEIASNLKHWLTRTKNLKNLATGSNYTLSGIAPANETGPDGKDYGLIFRSGEENPGSYLALAPTVYTDFSILFFVKDAQTGDGLFILKGVNNFYVKFTDATTIDVNGNGSVTVSSIGDSLWHHFALIRSDSTVYVYQNKVLKGSVTVSGTKGGNMFVIGDDQSGAFDIYDLRIYNTNISTGAIEYVYDDIVNNSGTKVLPLA